MEVLIGAIGLAVCITFFVVMASEGPRAPRKYVYNTHRSRPRKYIYRERRPRKYVHRGYRPSKRVSHKWRVK